MPSWFNILRDVLTIITLVWAVIEVGKSAKKDIDTPAIKQGERITALEGTVKKLEEYVDNDNKRLKALEDGLKVIQQSNLAMMEHLLDKDGNHIAALQEAKDELQRYLINR